MTVIFDRLHELADPNHQDNQFTIWPATAVPPEFILRRRRYVDPQIRNTYHRYSSDSYRQLVLAKPVLVVEDLTHERILYNCPHSGHCFAHINVLRQSWDQATASHVTVYIPKSVHGNRFTYTATDGVFYCASSTQKGRWSSRVQNPDQHGTRVLEPMLTGSVPIYRR